MSLGFARFAFAAVIAAQLVLAGLANQNLTPAQLREDVEGVAALVEREYFDPATARRVASTIRERLSSGRYADAKTSGELALRLTRDLVAETNDKHLHVALIPPATPQSPPGSDADRAVRGRRANFGVRRMEILAGNVGYLDLSSFFRLYEARDAIAAAMQLLQHADALILDLRGNGGGSPDTVAFLVTHFFAEPGLALFDIVPRTGTSQSYATATDASIARNASRPMYALTSASTFSGGEGLAFILQERRRAAVVGERTAGAANPGRPYPASDRLQVTVPNGQLRTAVTGRNWEGTGVAPDVTIAAADALRRAHAMALRQLIDKTTDSAWRGSLERHLRDLETGASK